MYIKNSRKSTIDISLLLAQIFIAILLFYFIWYVQVFGNRLIILYGATIASFGCIIVHLLKKGEINLSIYPIGIIIPFILVIYLFFTSLLVAHNKDSALSSTITFLAYNIVCFVITYISTEKKSIDWLIEILFWVSLLCSYWVTFRGIAKSGYGMVLGDNNNPNILGACMVLGIFATAYKAKNKASKSFLFILIALWHLYTIVGSGSRKSMIAGTIFFVSWIILLSFYTFIQGSSNDRIILIITVICVALVITYFITHIYFETDMANRMSHFSNENSNTFRIYLYQRALEIFNENLLFGVGINQFRNYSMHHAMAHSTYAEVIADFGIIGSLGYFFPIIYVLLCSITLIFNNRFNYSRWLCFVFLFVELFIGTGQVFFFQAEHFIAWSLIYFIMHDNDKFTENTLSFIYKKEYKKSKYIKLL